MLHTFTVHQQESNHYDMQNFQHYMGQLQREKKSFSSVPKEEY